MARRAVVSAADVAAGSSGGRRRQVASVGCVRTGGAAAERHQAQAVGVEFGLGHGSVVVACCGPSVCLDRPGSGRFPPFVFFLFYLFHIFIYYLLLKNTYLYFS